MRYYDADADRLVVAAEYYNPLQYWVAIARALAHERTFRHILTPATLDDIFDESLAVLRDCRNVGYLPDRAATSSGYRDELEAARDDLLELTHDLNRAEREGDDERYRTLRSTILRVAHGLAGTLIHLLDIADIEVVRELRLPEFARKHLSDDAFRSDLARTVAMGVAVQSSYGQFAAYRQLFEQRPQKRRSAIMPTVDAADPFGRLIGSFAIVGPRVTDLEADLRTAIRDLGAVHEDAPAFAIRVPIEDRSHARAAFAQATRTMCQVKRLAPTRQAISLLRALTGTPYDATAALHGLAPEPASRSPERDIRPDEIRYALSTLEPERLLPPLAPTIGRLVYGLLSAQTPLTQTELADQADVCTQSIRNHRDALEALSLVSEANGGLRFVLPFRAERGGSERSTLPWYAVGSPDRDQHLTFADVLFVVVERAIDDPRRLGDPDDSIGGVFFTAHSGFDPAKLVALDALAWLRPWLDVLEALLDREFTINGRLQEQDSRARISVLGDVPSQLAL